MKKQGNTNNMKYNTSVMDSLMKLQEFTSISWRYNGGPVCALSPTCSKSVFACNTINSGLTTQSFPHTNNNNLVWGWCAVTAFGNYNPTLGGHLILWELILVIEFPPGATILILCHFHSLQHYNTGVQNNVLVYTVYIWWDLLMGGTWILR